MKNTAQKLLKRRHRPSDNHFISFSTTEYSVLCILKIRKCSIYTSVTAWLKLEYLSKYMQCDVVRITSVA